MSVPNPTTSLGYQISHVREDDQGTTPAGALLEIPFATFDPSGGDVQRTKATNTNADRQTVANIANDVVAPSTSANSDLLYGHYDSLWEEVLGKAKTGPATYTGTDVAAVASGNKLTKGSGTWPFAAGDIVKVAGQTTNGASYLALVTGTSTVNLSLDAGYKTLVNESSGSSITVSYAAQYRCGPNILFATYQMWHELAGTGEVLRGHSMHGLTVQWTHPGAPTCQWSGMGAFTETITSALVNDVTPAAIQYPADSNVGFGAALAPTGFGGGFMYGGMLFPDLRIQSGNISFSTPNKTGGGSGHLGPLVLYGDSIKEIKVALKVSNGGDDARDLLAAARDPDTVASMGFCWRYPNGAIEHWLFPAGDPSKGKKGGLKQSGEDEFDLEWMFHADPTQTMFQRTQLG